LWLDTPSIKRTLQSSITQLHGNANNCFGETTFAAAENKVLRDLSVSKYVTI